MHFIVFLFFVCVCGEFLLDFVVSTLIVIGHLELNCVLLPRFCLELTEWLKVQFWL